MKRNASKKLKTILPLLFSVQLYADTMVSDPTRDLLIQKLTHVYGTLSNKDTAKVALTLRLADLHSERARSAATEELRVGCTVCNAGKADRETALRYYQEVLPKLNPSQAAKVLPQIGHLFELTGQEAKAIAAYEKVVAENSIPEAVGEANLSLAEIYFKARKYPLALKFYQAVLSAPQAGSKGLAAYRMAWAKFNSDQLEPAITDLKKILTTPELLSRSAAAGVVQIDKSFQEEVSRDLATFLARRSLTIADAEILFELSPEQAKLANIAYLANEAERVGQKQSAVTLWRFSQERQNTPRAKLIGHIRIAQLEMELGHTKEAGQEFDLGLNLWTTAVGAALDDEAKELKARLRKFVLDWNRVEKKQPSSQLADAYKSYLEHFSDEGDMTLWQAQVLRELKVYDKAVTSYQKSAELASGALKAGGPASADLKVSLEQSLLGAIETAEISKNNDLLSGAYDLYLKLSIERKRELDVLYQKANLVYESGDHQGASEQMYRIAQLNETKSPEAAKIRRQAADIALDALVLLKNDALLEKWSKEFAVLFPDQAAEYQKLARKSVLTQSAGLVTAGATATDLGKAWEVLQRFDLSTAPQEDKISFLKNRLILAEKLQKYSEARDSSEQLLRVQNLSAEDRQFALTRKAWLSELVFDFDSALTALAQTKANTDVPEDQRLLKLAMYADLAEKDSRPYLSQFLTLTHDEEKQIGIAAQLVRSAKDKKLELDHQKKILLKKPELYAQLLVEISALTGNKEIAKSGLKENGVKGTPSGRVLARIVLLDEADQLKTQVEKIKIDTSTQKKLAASLKARVAMIEKIEKSAGSAVDSTDWTAQVVALSLLQEQAEKFYSEVLALPVPQGLSGEDEQQYLQLLSQQAAPFQTKAQDVKKKLSEFWGQGQAMTALEKSLNDSTGPLRALVVREVGVLATVAPEQLKSQLVNISQKPEAQTDNRPQLAQIEAARQAVRESPLSRERLEALLKLERQAGRVAFVSYLENRISNSQSVSPKSEVR